MGSKIDMLSTTTILSMTISMRTGNGKSVRAINAHRASKPKHNTEYEFE